MSLVAGAQMAGAKEAVFTHAFDKQVSPCGLRYGWVEKDKGSLNLHLLLEKGRGKASVSVRS